MLGDWREPEGSIIRVERCDTGICLRLVSLSPTIPGTKDVHNPDRAQRGRTLCDLVIGGQFRMTDANHAAGGWLYDPKSGNTYHGAVTAQGNILKLRGYIGLSVFGRTETWQRAPTMVAACSDTMHR